MAIKDVSIVGIHGQINESAPAHTGRINTDHVLYAVAISALGGESRMLIALRVTAYLAPVVLLCSGDPSDLD